VFWGNSAIFRYVYWCALYEGHAAGPATRSFLHMNDDVKHLDYKYWFGISLVRLESYQPTITFSVSMHSAKKNVQKRVRDTKGRTCPILFVYLFVYLDLKARNASKGDESRIAMPINCICEVTFLFQLVTRLATSSKTVHHIMELAKVIKKGLKFLKH